MIGELLALLGATLVLLSAIGVVRFADVLARLHALAKASTLGILLLLAAPPSTSATSTTSPRSCSPPFSTCSPRRRRRTCSAGPPTWPAGNGERRSTSTLGPQVREALSSLVTERTVS